MKVVLSLLLACLVFLPGALEAPNASVTTDDCPEDLSLIRGKIKFVENFPDCEVQIVENFEDLRVKIVQNFPDDEGEWQIVENFPDYEIKIVENFPDFTIRYVENFPGVND